MTSDDKLIINVIASIAGGESIDWSVLDDQAGGDRRELLEQLRVLYDVGRVHGTLGAGSADDLPWQGDLDLAHLGDPPVWGSIRLLESVGRGTYGVVYRGYDQGLDRDVAVKLLRPARATPDDEAELIEEGRRLARIRHPNIVTVHGADRFNGIVGLWMEFVDGVTLERIVRERGPYSAAEATLIGIDVCSALAAVHGAGLLHRDVKAQNVMREQGGRIVLMDLGAGQDRRRDLDCEPLSLAGTPLYLAPELFAKTNRPTERSDLYSLGVLLYRLVTAAYPVEGATLAEIRKAHDDRTHRLLSDARTDVPRPFVRVVERALASDPTQRFDTAGAMGAALADSMDVSLARRTAPRDSTRSLSQARTVRWGSVGLVLAGVLLGSVALRLASDLVDGRDQNDGIPVLTRPRQLTTERGVERQPAWSPDGRTLAYQSDENGNDDIWILQVGGGPPLNLTADHPGADTSPAWSPDGTLLAFQSDRDGGAILVMSAQGGMPRRVAAVDPTESAHPQWSPDGSSLGYIVYDEEFRPFMEVTSLTTGEANRFQLPGDVARRRYDLRWSPDGRWVAYVVAGGRASRDTQLMLLGLDEATSLPVTDARHSNWSPSWSPDGRSLFFVTDRGGTRDLWVQRLGEDGSPSGSAAPVTAGIGIRSAAIATTASAVAYTRGRIVANLWRVPILQNGPATWTRAEQMTFDQAFIEFVDVSPTGDQLIFSSDRSGNHDLWLLTVQTATLQRITSDPDDDWDPSWSPDGRRIAFYSNRAGSRDIWVMSLGSALGRPMTRDEPRDFGPTWSPDGREIAFWSDRSGNNDIWVTSTDDRVTRQVTRHTSADLWPDWSPSGDWIAFQSERPGGGIWRAPAHGGEPRIVTSLSGGRPRWRPDGQALYFIRREGRSSDIWSVTVDSGSVRRMTRFEDRRGSLGPVALAADQEYLYFTWEVPNQDLWVMDIERPTPN